MSETSDPGPKSGKFRIAVIAILACAAAGAGLGFGAPILMADARESDPVEIAPPEVSELQIGRITVALRPTAPDSKARFLVLDTIIEYEKPVVDGQAGSSAFDSSQPRVRDAFIEYLSQVSETEISGSSGIAKMRHELLRRARTVAGNDAPKAILIQDYIIQ